MDMELEKRNIECYETVLDTSALHEENMEIIVPDASPDMLRIVNASGAAFVKDKTLREGALDVNGMVKGCVLYVAEGDKIIRRLEVSIPFKHTFDAKGITPSSKAVVTARVQSMDAREINPRKIAVRVNVAIYAKVYRNIQFEMCSGIVNPNEYSIQTKKKQAGIYVPVAIKEKSFTINDDVEIPQSCPPFASILKQDVNLVTNDMKIIGNKAIMKGVANIKCLYNTRDGFVAVCEHELPYSQIIDIEGMEEECDLTVKLCMRAVELEPQHDMSGDTRFISVNILVDANAIAYLKGDIDVVEDIYSTMYDLNTQFETKHCNRFIDRLSKRIAVTESIETGSPIKNVVDLSIYLEPATKRMEEGGQVLSNEAMITVLYIGEDDTAYCASRRCSVVCPLGVEDSDCDYACDVAVTGANHTAGMANEIIIRFFADYDITQTKDERISCLASINLDSEQIKDLSKTPSVIIKYVNSNQAVWDVAKRYNTTMDEIASANALDDTDYIEAGSMILIPKKR